MFTNAVGSTWTYSCRFVHRLREGFANQLFALFPEGLCFLGVERIAAHPDGDGAHLRISGDEFGDLSVLTDEAALQGTPIADPERPLEILRTVHLLGFSDLMGVLRLIDAAPAEVVLLGVQPESTDWGTALTPAVETAREDLDQAALGQIGRWLEEISSFISSRVPSPIVS